MNDSLNHIRQTVILTQYYSFDLGSYQIKDLIIKWNQFYPLHWIPLAVTEAIYQGRLKAVSIEQILNVWLKKGAISYSFNYEFIRLIQPDDNFKLAPYKEQECQDILKNYSGSIDRPEKSPLYPAQNNYRYASSGREKKEANSNKRVNQFKPLADSSRSFQKLKSLAISNNGNSQQDT